MVSEYAGTLRARITVLDGGRVQVEWVDAAGVAVWTETCAPREGCAFVSQVECSGEFRTLPGYFVDEGGKRHFVLKADPGSFGAAMSKVGATR